MQEVCAKKFGFIFPKGLDFTKFVWYCVVLPEVYNMRRITKNAIQCKLCKDIIESKSRHDFVKCKCGACAVDGGHDYLRRCATNGECFIELSESMEISEEERCGHES